MRSSSKKDKKVCPRCSSKLVMSLDRIFCIVCGFEDYSFIEISNVYVEPIKSIEPSFKELYDKPTKTTTRIKRKFHSFKVENDLYTLCGKDLKKEPDYLNMTVKNILDVEEKDRCKKCWNIKKIHIDRGVINKRFGPKKKKFHLLHRFSSDKTRCGKNLIDRPDYLSTIIYSLEDVDLSKICVVCKK